MSRHDTDGRSDQRLTSAAFVAIALLGGGNPVGVSVAVDELDPFWAAGSRFVIAGAIFALLMLVLRIPLPRGSALSGALVYGTFAIFASFALLFEGFRETPPGTGQVIIALAPLMTIFLAVAHRLERFRIRALVGALIALAGLVFLLADRLEVDVPLPSLMLVLAGAAFLAEGGVVIKLTPRAHPVASNAIGMLGGGTMLLILSAMAGDAWVAPGQSDTWVAMAYLVIAGSMGVFGLYLFLLSRWSASSASYVLLLQPVSALVYSAILTSEPLTPALVVGAAVVLLGVYVGTMTTTAARPMASGAPEVGA